MHAQKGPSDTNIIWNTNLPIMRAQIVECFRPLLGAQQWDYIVVWKLGDDPSRFIEWMGCCCSGGYDCGNEKEDRGENSHSSSFCRDTCVKHPVRTKACEALAQLPSSMPLYSGVHTEVVISRQLRWVRQVGHGADSNYSRDSAETQVLFPVDDGLIEFYAAKHIPKDQEALEMIFAHCNIALERENLGTLPQQCMQKRPSSLHLFSLSPRSEALPLDYTEEFLKQQTCLVSGCGVEKAAKKVTWKKERGNYKSTNLISERNRRKRIKTALFTLRSLVPNITKMDTASIVRDAVTYIRELQKDEKELQEELKKTEKEEEESQKMKNGYAIPELDKGKGVSSCLPPADNIQMQVEVKQTGKTECLIKVFCEHKHGGFVRLMEAIDSLELHVVNANLTAFNGRVQNVLEVKADKDIQAVKLRNLLIKLAG